jgi:ureidoglycolate lyase
MKKITVQELSPESFKSYGWAVMPQQGAPDIQNAFIDYWHEVADLSVTGTPWHIGFMRVKKNPPVLSTLQKLRRSVEMYFTLDGGPGVEFVALSAPDGSPDLATLKCFSLSGGQSIIVDRDVWHCTPFALAEKTDYALVLAGDVLVRTADGTLGVDRETIDYFSLEETFTI